MDSLQAGSELVNFIPQQISLRPPQLVSEFCQSFHFIGAFRPCFRWQLAQPVQNRHVSRFGSKENDFCFRHPLWDVRTIANIVKAGKIGKDTGCPRAVGS